MLDVDSACSRTLISTFTALSICTRWDISSTAIEPVGMYSRRYVGGVPHPLPRTGIVLQPHDTPLQPSAAIQRIRYRLILGSWNVGGLGVAPVHGDGASIVVVRRFTHEARGGAGVQARPEGFGLMVLGTGTGRFLYPHSVGVHGRSPCGAARAGVKERGPKRACRNGRSRMMTSRIWCCAPFHACRLSLLAGICLYRQFVVTMRYLL